MSSYEYFIKSIEDRYNNTDCNIIEIRLGQRDIDNNFSNLDSQTIINCIMKLKEKGYSCLFNNDSYYTDGKIYYYFDNYEKEVTVLKQYLDNDVLDIPLFKNLKVKFKKEIKLNIKEVVEKSQIHLYGQHKIIFLINNDIKLIIDKFNSGSQIYFLLEKISQSNLKIIYEIYIELSIS